MWYQHTCAENSSTAVLTNSINSTRHKTRIIRRICLLSKQHVTIGEVVVLPLCLANHWYTPHTSSLTKNRWNRIVMVTTT